MLLILILVCFSLSGCVTKDGYQNEKTDQILSAEAFALLTPEQQADFITVKYKELNPAISKNIDTGLGAASGTVQVVKPFIPEPYATGIVSLLAIIGTTWGLIKNKKTTGILNNVKLGAQITAASVDSVIKPSVELYKVFAARQEKESKNTAAIMPDELINLPV